MTIDKSDIMEIPVPKVRRQAFNEKALSDGTAVLFKYEVNDHPFFALVQEWGPYHLTMSTGFMTNGLEVDEVLSGICEIKPLHNDEPVVIEVDAFDVHKIPVGAFLIDPDGVPFIISEVDDFYLELRNYNDETSDIQASIFFALDPEEQAETKIHLPPLYVREMIKKAEAYKHINEVFDE